jgi:hypothetical protein
MIKLFVCLLLIYISGISCSLIYIHPFSDSECNTSVTVEHGGITLNASKTCTYWEHSGGAEVDSASAILCGDNWVSFTKHPGCNDCSCNPHIVTRYLDQCDEAVIGADMRLWEKLVEPYIPCPNYSPDEYGPPSDEIDTNEETNESNNNDDALVLSISIVFIFGIIGCIVYVRRKTNDEMKRSKARLPSELEALSMEEEDFGEYDPHFATADPSYVDEALQSATTNVNDVDEQKNDSTTLLNHESLTSDGI